MQNVNMKSLVFFMTFSVAVCVSFGWHFFTMPLNLEISPDVNFESTPIQTTVCKIEDYSNDFNGKLVRFKATTYAYENELIMYPLDCNMDGDYPNYFLHPSIKLNNEFTGINSNLITILQNQKPPSDNPDYKDFKEVDVEVTGIVKEFYDEDGHKLFSIIPKKIEIISAFRQFEPKGAA